MDNKNLYILTYDHGGFVLWGDKVKSCLGTALEWLEKYPAFKTGLDYEAFTFDEMDRIAPEINETIAGALKRYAGRFGLGSSTYAQPLSLFVSEESNVRQLTYAIRTNLAHFGCTPTVYAISEFALNNQTPQLLKLCGYAAAIMRTHVMNFGYQRTFDKPFGLWTGKDGTGIPAVPSYDGEGRGYTNTTLDNWILTRWPGGSEYSLEDFAALFGQYRPLLASRYDDLTLRKEELVTDAVKHDDWEFVLLEELPDLFGAPAETLATDDNDFHGRMPWGYCGNEIFNGVRATEVEAWRAERANAFSVLLGGESEQPALEEAWKNALILQHHDITICGLLSNARRFIPASLDLSRGAAARSLAAMAPAFSSPDAETVLAVNPASSPVTEWIETAARGCASAFDGEEALPVERDGDKLRVLVSLPPLTARAIRLDPAPSAVPAGDWSYDEASGLLKTPRYRIKLNERGIVFLEDASGRRLADNGDGALFRGWIEDRDTASTGKWTVTLAAHSAEAVQTGEIGGIPFTFTMRLARGTDRIDCSAWFDIAGQHIGRTGVTKGILSDHVINGFVHEEKLRFVLDLCLDRDRRMVRDLPFSLSDWNDQIPLPEPFWYEGRLVLADRPVDHETAFATPTYLQGVYWLALRDRTGGVAFFNRGCGGSAIEGNRVNLPLIYANDYFCGTVMLNGRFGGEFALFPFGTGESDAAVHREALAYEYPVLTADAARGNGRLVNFEAARLDARGGEVILTALYPENGAMVARFCNYSDEAAGADFVPSAGRVTAETDLLGKVLRETDGTALSFRPWEIKTLRIEL